MYTLSFFNTASYFDLVLLFNWYKKVNNEQSLSSGSTLIKYEKR